jgi:hemoglobin
MSARGRTDRINQKFARTNLDRLTKEFIDQLCQDTGGPCTYTGLSMKQSHTNMGVTNGEFDAFMEDLGRGAGRLQGRESRTRTSS